MGITGSAVEQLEKEHAAKGDTTLTEETTNDNMSYFGKSKGKRP